MHRVRLITVLVAAIALTTTAIASAATLKYPPSGVSHGVMAQVGLVWTWFGDETAAKVVFTNSADPADPVWISGTPPQRFETSSQPRDPVEPDGVFLQGLNAPNPIELPNGIWYWRVCTTSATSPAICTLSAETRVFTMDPIGECHDDFDNDFDGKIDLDDKGCIGRRDQTEILTKLPKLGPREARRKTREILSTHFEGSWDNGYARKVKCHRITSRRKRCKVSWVLGDVSWSGVVRLWVARDIYDVGRTRYSFNITQLNEYCAGSGGSHCSRRIKRTNRLLY